MREFFKFCLCIFEKGVLYSQLVLFYSALDDCWFMFEFLRTLSKRRILYGGIKKRYKIMIDAKGNLFDRL